ncbi:mycofactocin-coupled SDR family oxidoreductase [Gordonia polyisoprenivorans]|uniref:mycofactocin-coupled SDR family oxidoreductase n=1 Tax=Gordonia polyisoprenivorans TaxID=84595 RepID=UPI001AD70A22|nr:mycofactocin-coupled SDR family oxidoreductase [Gordonia polyisoprenivorans]QTI70879.1 mycofactocin-coupled SDR family oxidoreductase [Gordonia polyisoprenivorans]
MTRLEGKVVFITGIARGQGRSHAVRMAQEGARIIGMDICDQIPTVFYPMATREDLAETERLVKEAGAEIVTTVGDVRKREDIERALDLGIEQFGRLDTVIANAGIMPVIGPGDQPQAWHDAVDVMLTGVWQVLDETVPRLVQQGTGGSIIITSSAAGLTSMGLNTFAGQAGYTASKHGVVGLMRLYSKQLAKDSIRVNTVHPTGVNTPMVANAEYGEFVNTHPEVANDEAYKNPMPVELIEAVDVSNAMVFLASDEARYITGITLPVDAGYNNR